MQTDQISCHGEPTLSVFLDPFDDLFLELRPLALPATICTFGFRQRLYVVNLPSPVSDLLFVDAKLPAGSRIVGVVRRKLDNLQLEAHRIFHSFHPRQHSSTCNAS